MIAKLLALVCCVILVSCDVPASAVVWEDLTITLKSGQVFSYKKAIVYYDYQSSDSGPNYDDDVLVVECPDGNSDTEDLRLILRPDDIAEIKAHVNGVQQEL